MAVRKNSMKLVDPCIFLWALKNNLPNIRGATSDLDPGKYVGDTVGWFRLAKRGVISDKPFTLQHKKSQFLVIPAFASEGNLDMLTLPVSAEIQTSINQFVKLE